jgi:hypothetical protein
MPLIGQFSSLVREEASDWIVFMFVKKETSDWIVSMSAEREKAFD